MGDEINGQSKVAVATRPAYPMQISLGCLGKVKIDNDIHSLNVYTTCQQIYKTKYKIILRPKFLHRSCVSIIMQMLTGTDKVSTFSITEVMKYSVAV